MADKKKKAGDVAGSREREKEAKDKEKDEKQALIDTLQRLQADFENYKKRIEKETERFRELANQDLIERLLPVLDNFSLAIKAEQNLEDFAKGVHLIFSEFRKVLNDFGVQEIETEDRMFDPTLHEAMMTGKDRSKKDGAILEEFQKGYTLAGKVLRHARVRVNKLDE